MNKLERNLIDNILESEVKLGRPSTSITFYYPESSLTELLECGTNELDFAIDEFKREEQNRLGNVVFEKSKDEKVRYAVRISIEGFDWVHAHFKPSDFLNEFVMEIKKPDNSLEKIEALFRRYSNEVIINKMSSDEWAISFKDENIDPYIYHIEQSVFGLEYHRFTKESYKKMMNEEAY